MVAGEPDGIAADRQEVCEKDGEHVACVRLHPQKGKSVSESVSRSCTPLTERTRGD